MSKTSSNVVRIIAEQSVVVSIKDLKKYPKNPRVGNIPAIRESIRENGFFAPLIVQKSTSYVLAGNHRMMAAIEEGYTELPVVYLDISDEDAKRVVLSDNRTDDLATYDTSILSDLLGNLSNPDLGTGYSTTDVSDLIGAIQDNDSSSVQAIIRPPMPSPLSDTEWGEDDNSMSGGAPGMGGEDGPVYDATQMADEEDIESLDDQLGELQGLLQLREDVQWPGKNYYEFPELRSDMLLDKLPDLLDTWGGHDATPDDGVTTWVWNYGVASKKNLPMDRAILCFYTYDTYFDSFWDMPAYMTAKVLNAGIKYAVVPDYSYYSDTGVATWVYNHHRAQWVGRFFQEAGIKVIPRLQYAIDKPDSASLDFNTMGIPKGAPIVAKCSHNANSNEEFALDCSGLITSLEKIMPKTLLIYGGKPAARLIESTDPVGKGLCEEVVHIYNYAHKRRGVVFDKKDGLAAMNKDKRRQIRDASETQAAFHPDAVKDERKVIENGKKADREAAKKAATEEPTPEESTDETL